MPVRQFSVAVDEEIVEAARRETGMSTAPLAELVRRALLMLAGRQDAADAARVKMGRPRKTSPT